MAESEGNGVHFRGALAADVVVYRILSRKSQINPLTGKPVNTTFYRRAPHPEIAKERDTEGLSVAIAYKLSFEDLAAYFLTTRSLYCYAFVRLSVHDILSLSTVPQLRVVQNSNHHANIVGLPKHGEDDATADELANALSEISEVVWTNPVKKS